MFLRHAGFRIIVKNMGNPYYEPTTVVYATTKNVTRGSSTHPIGKP